jgi:hypothetical protein
MVVSLLPAAKVMVARLLALRNANSPMVVTPTGTMMAVSALAPENAPSLADPIIVSQPFGNLSASCRQAAVSRPSTGLRTSDQTR